MIAEVVVLRLIIIINQWWRAARRQLFRLLLALLIIITQMSLDLISGACSRSSRRHRHSNRKLYVSGEKSSILVLLVSLETHRLVEYVSFKPERRGTSKDAATNVCDDANLNSCFVCVQGGMPTLYGAFRGGRS